MVEKVIGISKGCVASSLWCADLSLAIVENDNLVYAEDGTCSRYLTSQGGFLVMSEGIGDYTAGQSNAQGEFSTLLGSEDCCWLRGVHVLVLVMLNLSFLFTMMSVNTP